MAETETPAEGGMPTPDMTRSIQQAERSLSPRERQKLEAFRQEHPDADTPKQGGQEGDMPDRGMSE